MQKRDHFRDLGINRRIKVEWVLEKECVNVWTGFNWLRRESNGRILSTWNEPSSSIKAGNFLICRVSNKFSRKIMHHGISQEVLNKEPMFKE
jgi:hypothetical protein